MKDKLLTLTITFLLIGYTISANFMTTFNMTEMFDEIDHRKTLANCISQALRRYLHHSSTIIYSTESIVSKDVKSPETMFNLLLSDLFKSARWTVLTRKPNASDTVRMKTPTREKKCDCYILQIWSFVSFFDHLMYLRGLRSWNPHAKFIIFSTLYFNKLQAITSIISHLWRFNILNGVILLPALKNESVFEIFSWYPFRNKSCGDSLTELEQIATCHGGKQWFENKIPNDLHQCKVKLRTIVYAPFMVGPAIKVPNTLDEYTFKSGLEFNMLTEISNAANISFVYTMSETPHWGTINLTAKSYTGIVGMLFNGSVDAAIGSLTPNPIRHIVFDATPAYYQDSLEMCVAHADRKPTWKLMLSIFSVLASILILLMFCIIVILLYVINRYYDKEKKFKKFGDVVLKAYQLMLSNAIPSTPKSIHLRILMMFWVLGCLLITTAFQGKLMSTLTEASYVKQVASIKDIHDHDLVVLVLEAKRSFFETFLSELPPNYIRWDICPDFDVCIKRMLLKKDAALLSSGLYMSLAKELYRNVDGAPLLYCFPEPIISFPIVGYMRSGFPFGDRINNLIQMFLASGLFDNWQKVMKREMQRSGFKSQMSQHHDDASHRTFLMFQHISPVFIVYLVGIAIACVAFIMELVVNRAMIKYNSKRKKKNEERILIR